MLDLQEILSKHERWLNGFEDGIRINLIGADLSGADLSEANLSEANLSRADLSRADLYGADLSGADLSGADLSEANLSEANLSRANLSRADLSGADLSEANLSEADLYGADLSGADLSEADLSEADLSGADLSEANLSEANLSRANLSRANLSRADLSGADLRRAKNTNSVLWSIYTSFYPLQCPEKGSFIGYKKAGNIIIELEICEDALRSSATSRKCRCSKAKVISFETLDGKPVDLPEVRSNHDANLVYRVGEMVKVNNFDPDRWNECSAGIHFFITRDEAVKYEV